MIPGVLCQSGKSPWILGINNTFDPYFSDVVNLWHVDTVDDAVDSNDWFGGGYIQSNIHYGANAAVVSYANGNEFCGITAQHSNAAFLSTDWTLEFFVKVENHPTIQTLFSKGGDNGIGSDGYTERSIDILADGKIRYATYSSGTQGSIASIVSTNSIEYGKWLHIAVVQQNTLSSIYVGGVLFASGVIWRPTSPYWGMRLGNHCYPDNRQQSGAAFDEFRLTQNIARYTTTFTPPNIQYYGQYTIDAQFNTFPLVDSAGNYTINNVNVGQSGGHAIFDGTSPQYLTFIGAETFNLQEKLTFEILFSSSLIAYQVHTLLDLSGPTSYLVIQHSGLGATYTVFLTGSTGGNTDNYTITGGNTFFGLFQGGTLKLVYDPSLGTLKTYVNGVLDINQTGITARVNETRTMCLSSPTLPRLSANVDYFKVIVG